MTRCPDFYYKWLEYGGENWCEKTPGAVSQINAYLKIVNILEEHGVPQSFTFVNLPEGAARSICSIKETDIKDKVITKVLNSLKAKKSYKEQMKKGDPDCGKMCSADVAQIIHDITVPKKEPAPAALPMDSDRFEYYMKLRSIDRLGEDTTNWVEIDYEEYEHLIDKWGTVSHK